MEFGLQVCLILLLLCGSFAMFVYGRSVLMEHCK